MQETVLHVHQLAPAAAVASLQSTARGLRRSEVARRLQVSGSCFSLILWLAAGMVPGDIVLLATGDTVPDSPCLDEIPDRLRLSTLHQGPGGPARYCKSVPESVPPLCRRRLRGAAVLPLDPAGRAAIVPAQEAMARRGLRLPALAYRPCVQSPSASAGRRTSSSPARWGSRTHRGRRCRRCAPAGRPASRSSRSPATA